MTRTPLTRGPVGAILASAAVAAGCCALVSAATAQPTAHASACLDVDGPYRVFPQPATPDAAVAERLEDIGYRVQEEASWPEAVQGYGWVCKESTQ